MTGIDWVALTAELMAHPPLTSAECGRYDCEPGWSWRRSFDDHDAWLVLRGRGRGHLLFAPETQSRCSSAPDHADRCDVGAAGRTGPRRQEVVVHAGTLLMLRPGDSVSMDQDPGDRITALAVHYDFRDRHTGAARPFAASRLPDRVSVLLHMTPVVDLMVRLIRLSRDPHPLRRLEADGTLIGLLAEIYRQQAQLNGEAVPTVDPRLQTVVDAIAGNPSQRWGLGEAAGIAGMPASVFSRLFSRAMGVSFRQFVVQTRLERARTLLTESSMSVSQVARALGYPDPFGFSRQFTGHFGEPPSAMRVSQQGLDVS